MVKGIIYTRASSPRQEAEGHGLESQYAVCAQFADRKGIPIERNFSDTWTGRSSDRPGLTDLISHVRRNRRVQWVIIFDDTNRFARDLRDHLELREKLRKAGCLVMTPSREFKDDPDPLLVENILASVSQHWSMKNREAVMSRMLGCLHSGHWPFRLPYGYTRATPAEGKGAVKFDPHFTIVADVFRNFAVGNLENRAAVRDFLADQPAYRAHHPNAQVTVERVNRILTNVFYSGYLEYPKWGVPLLKARHEPAVDFETFSEIQQMLRLGRRACFVSRGED